MYTTLGVTPVSRINDLFIKDERIVGSYPVETVWSSLVPRCCDAGATRYRADFYKKIALDIVTETVFNYPYPYITEKTLRPIACKRIFIIVGAANTLQTLKDYGFKTWSDILDESYDTILDHELRFLSIINSIDQFCKIPLKKIKCLLSDRQDQLNHNFEVLQSLRENEINKLKQRLKNY